MKTIAVILARSGSRGLPNKNAAPVADKPMLGWTIEHALATPTIDRVVLSTDGDDLARIARSYHIDVVLRPRYLAADTASIDAAVRYSVEADEAGQTTYGQVAILYGNVPVRPTDLTYRALQKLRDAGCDSVQSVTPVGKHHPYWMKRLTGADGDEMKPYIENTIDRRQDLPPLFGLDGGVIAVTRASLFTLDRGHPHAFLGSRRRAIKCEPGDVIDVDTPADLAVADAILRRREAQVPARRPKAA